MNPTLISAYMCGDSIRYKLYGLKVYTSIPVRIAQLDTALDLKTRGCGFDSRAGQPNKY